MNCEEVQKELSAFLDKALAIDDANTIDHHLASCPRCREELDTLAECQRLVSALPPVDPPERFATRVMAEVREVKGMPTFWERLFFPLRIKLPLQATAAILLAILSLYLYEPEQRFKSDKADELNQPASRPENQELAENPADPAIPTEPPARAKKQAEVTIKPPLETAKRLPQDTSQGKAANEKLRQASKSARVADNKSGLENKEGSAKPPSLPEQELAAATEKAKTSSEAISRGASRLTESRRQDEGGPAPLAADRALPSSPEPTADYELIVKRRPRQLRDQAAPVPNLESLQKRAEIDVSSKPVERRSSGHSSALPPVHSPAEILWYTVPQDRYEQFKKELSVQGSIESEIPLAQKQKESATQRDRALSIKVTILPAAAENTSPDYSR